MGRSMIVGWFFLWLPATVAQPADWPTYRADAARSGYTAERLAANLSGGWTYHYSHPPRPAWPRAKRLVFDRFDQPIIAGGKLFFGSSADGKLYATDAATGRLLWTFFTGGPIRLAPVAWKDRVFVASDDGHLYALGASDGRLLWKHRGGPDGSMRLGNGRMISKWPARGGPVLCDDTLYYAAGIWPSDGIFVYALDARTGQVRWVNDDSGGIQMPQPHKTAVAASGISAQGYLLAMGKQLFVSTGRSVPAAFDRATGKFQYFHLHYNNSFGGSFAMAARGYLYNSGTIFDAKTGTPRGGITGHIVATPDGVVRAREGTVTAYEWGEVQWEKRGRRGRPLDVRPLEKLWSIDGVGARAELIVAGATIVCGAHGHVDLCDADAGKVVQSIPVDGFAGGLAVADGRLYVATDRGTIHCFDHTQRAKPTVIERKPDDGPYGANTLYAKAAEEILRRFSAAEGYCLDIGCGDGALAFELARQSDLYVCAIESDGAKVAEARRKLDAAGLLGPRVVVHHADLNASGYPRYFANLVVSGRSITEGAEVVPQDEVRRIQRPFGGMACIGKPGAMSVTVRGELPGAGSWTHQYADPANTVCSDDELLEGRLGILWYRDVDLERANRHGRSPAPLFFEGRLVYAGVDEIRAIDAYNGRRLWSYSLPGLLQAYNNESFLGVSGTGGNYCLAGDSVYVRHEDYCLRIDAATGKQLGRFALPDDGRGNRAVWGYLACTGDLLYGSRADPRHVVTHRYGPPCDMSGQLTESTMLFALNAKTGELKWKYEARESIRHNAIAVGVKHVYLIDRAPALFDRQKRPSRRAWREESAWAAKQPGGELLALDAITGEVVWKQSDDVYGTMLAASDKHGALLMAYQVAEEHLDSEVGRRMSVFDLTDGKLMWTKAVNYGSRLIINDRIIYAGAPGSPPYEKGGAWDLLTADPKPFDLRRSYGCGIFTSCRKMLFFRSSALGYFDLDKNEGVENFGGTRPGCWINAIGAGGLVLLPDATAGCNCSHLNRCWVALEPLQ